MFNEKLSEAVDASGLDLTEVERAAGVYRGGMSRYIAGRMPGADIAVRIARALGTTVEALWGDAE